MSNMGWNVMSDMGRDVICRLRKYSTFALGDVGCGVGCHMGHEAGCYV